MLDWFFQLFSFATGVSRKGITFYVFVGIILASTFIWFLRELRLVLKEKPRNPDAYAFVFISLGITGIAAFLMYATPSYYLSYAIASCILTVACVLLAVAGYLCWPYRKRFFSDFWKTISITLCTLILVSAIIYLFISHAMAIQVTSVAVILGAICITVLTITTAGLLWAGILTTTHRLKSKGYHTFSWVFIVCALLPMLSLSGWLLLQSSPLSDWVANIVANDVLIAISAFFALISACFALTSLYLPQLDEEWQELRTKLLNLKKSDLQIFLAQLQIELYIAAGREPIPDYLSNEIYEKRNKELRSLKQEFTKLQNKGRRQIRRFFGKWIKLQNISSLPARVAPACKRCMHAAISGQRDQLKNKLNTLEEKQKKEYLYYILICSGKKELVDQIMEIDLKNNTVETVLKRLNLVVEWTTLANVDFLSRAMTQYSESVSEIEGYFKDDYYKNAFKDVSIETLHPDNFSLKNLSTEKIQSLSQLYERLRLYVEHESEFWTRFSNAKKEASAHSDKNNSQFCLLILQKAKESLETYKNNCNDVAQKTLIGSLIQKYESTCNEAKYFSETCSVLIKSLYDFTFYKQLLGHDNQLNVTKEIITSVQNIVRGILEKVFKELSNNTLEKKQEDNNDVKEEELQVNQKINNTYSLGKKQSTAPIGPQLKLKPQTGAKSI